METKVYNISNQIERYRDLAQNRMEKGDNLGALDYLFSALRIKPTLDVIVDIADNYADMGLYEKSNAFWYKYLDKAPKDKHEIAFYELAVNYFYLNELKTSAYYFHLKMQEDDEIDEEMGKELFEALTENARENKEYYIAYPFDRADYSSVSDRAKLELGLGKYQQSIKTYNKLPKESKDYKKSLKEMSLAYFLKGDYKKAISLSNQDIKLNGKNVQSLCNLSSVYYAQNDKEKSEEYLNKAIKIKDKSLEDYFKIAISGVERNNHKIVNEYMAKFLKENVQAIMLKNIYAISFFNLKDFNGAMKVFNEVLRIDSKNFTAKFYYEVCEKCLEDENYYKNFFPIDYNNPIRKEEIKKRKEYIKEIYSLPIEKRDNNYKRKEFCDLIIWGIIEGDKETAEISQKIICQSTTQKSVDMALELLLDVRVQENVKMMLVYYLILKGYKKPFGAVFGGIFVKVKRGNPVFENKPDGVKVFIGYALAIANLYAITKTDSERLCKSADRVYFNVKDRKDLNLTKEEIAGLICKEYKYPNFTDDIICDVFNIDGKVLKIYEEITEKNNE